MAQVILKSNGRTYEIKKDYGSVLSLFRHKDECIGNPDRRGYVDVYVVSKDKVEML
jgi:hypothetical protein